MASQEADSVEPTRPPQILRSRAEKLLRTTRSEIADMQAADIQALVHELQVHQMELEIQNEELRRAQLELAESRDSYSNLYEFAPVGFLTLGQDGRILEANLTAATMFGVVRGVLTGSTLTRFIDRADQDVFYQCRQQMASGDLHQSCELRMLRVDGSSFTARLESVAVRDHEDQPPSFRTALSDITEISHAEQALRREHHFSENIIDTVKTVILLLDLEGRVIRFNRYFEELSGWRSDDAIGRDWVSTFIPKRFRSSISEVFEQAIMGAATNTNFNAVLMKDGSERLIEWNNSPLTDADGTNIGLLCAGIDVTERQRLEQQVVNASEEERRRIARDLHDGLGSLLTGIGLRAELLASECSNCMLPQAGKSTEIAQLIRDAIKQTSGIARGLYPLGSDPEDLMSHLANLIQRRNAETTAECSFELGSPVLIEDPHLANHLYRIAQEAFNNAIKYSRAEHITVSLAEEKDHVVLQILDDGKGFDPPPPRAKGLGLHVMKYRAHAIDAHLFIERRGKRGMRVLCSVPINPAAASPS